jgi:predicted ribosome quality control (RQC) complex YloA/Tae2 family protein
MFFDAAMMARACAEVEHRLVGARLREPVQLRHDEVLLIFGRDLAEGGLLLSSSPEVGRVCFAPIQKAPAAPQPFGLALRRHLRGARLAAVTQPRFDRLLRFEFEECMGFGAESRRALIVEVMGKHGNMVLVDEHDAIVSCAKHVPGRINRYREIMEGEPYLPPPIFDKLDPRQAAAGDWAARALQGPGLGLPDFLIAHCLGTSRVFAAEMVARLGPWPDVGAATEPQFDRLVEALREITAEAAGNGPVHVYERPPGTDLPERFAYPVRLRCGGEPLGSAAHLGAALSPLLQTETERRRAQELRQRLTGAAAAQLRSLNRRLAAWRDRVGKAEAAEADRRIGELLLAQPHAASPYAETVDLVDYYADGAPTLTVALDPPGDSVRTAERHFARYRRARRTLERVPPLVDRAEKEARYLESVLAEIDLAEGLDDLAAVEEELAEQGYLRERQQRSPVRRDRRSAPRLHAATSAEGYPILYGTNHLQNEELIREAEPDDIWLHAQGVPGAHVLIRSDGRPDRVPRATLLEAARLAAWWSRARSQGTVDVDYTLAKHVRKAKGERPGMVYYTHQKSLVVSL